MPAGCSPGTGTSSLAGDRHLSSPGTDTSGTDTSGQTVGTDTSLVAEDRQLGAVSPRMATPDHGCSGTLVTGDRHLSSPETDSGDRHRGDRQWGQTPRDKQWGQTPRWSPGTGNSERSSHGWQRRTTDVQERSSPADTGDRHLVDRRVAPGTDTYRRRRQTSGTDTGETDSGDRHLVGRRGQAPSAGYRHLGGWSDRTWYRQLGVVFIRRTALPSVRSDGSKGKLVPANAKTASSSTGNGNPWRSIGLW